MTEPFAQDELGTTPTIQVAVYRDGALIHRQPCETELEAGEVVEI